MKTLSIPPPLIGVVMESVCLLFGKKENWDESKKFMNQIDFI
jgi:hypothetical protein